MADFGEALPCEGVQLYDGSSPCTYHSEYSYDWAKLNLEAVGDAAREGEVEEGEVHQCMDELWWRDESGRKHAAVGGEGREL